MAVTPETRRWDSLFAVRTRGNVGEGIADILALLGVPDLISFAGGFPDPLTFPRERASALLAEFAELGEGSAFQYAPTRGLHGPLDALAGRLEALQGRRPAEDELLITSGAIEALELICKSFLDRGDVVVVEGPTYLGAIMAFRGFEAEVVAVPMDEHGLQVDELERRLAEGSRPKLLYTIPDHQNPAGVSLSTERRALLVERKPGRRRRPSFPACVSAGLSALPKCPRSSSRRSRTPTSVRARLDSGSLRSTCAAAGSTTNSRCHEPCIATSASEHSRRLIVACRRM